MAAGAVRARAAARAGRLRAANRGGTRAVLRGHQEPATGGEPRGGGGAAVREPDARQDSRSAPATC